LTATAAPNDIPPQKRLFSFAYWYIRTLVHQ
jgi:hypothetical protein